MSFALAGSSPSSLMFMIEPSSVLFFTRRMCWQNLLRRVPFPGDRGSSRRDDWGLGSSELDMIRERLSGILTLPTVILYLRVLPGRPRCISICCRYYDCHFCIKADEIIWTQGETLSTEQSLTEVVESNAITVKLNNWELNSLDRWFQHKAMRNYPSVWRYVNASLLTLRQSLQVAVTILFAK